MCCGKCSTKKYNFLDLNDTLVRAYFCFARLETAAHTNLLNQLYDRMWLYYNFFQPVMRLSEKTILCQATPVSTPASSAATTPTTD